MKMNHVRLNRNSRTAEIEIDRCRKNFESTYELILTAARRTRKLQQRQKMEDPWAPMITPVDALLEAQRGELNRDDYLTPSAGLSIEDYYRGRLKK